MPTLDRFDVASLQQINATHVEGTVASLKQFLVNSDWVDPNNRYAHDIVKRLGNDHPLTPSRKADLAHFIAASSALHVGDGWGYLGKAISCLINGDPHRALHLAYYAELRAALSLLATAGVGVFNGHPHIISGLVTTSRLRFSAGTHVAAWELLNWWSHQSDSGKLLAKIVKPEGRSLEEWLSPIRGSTIIAAQARDWFSEWGMDLQHATKDRDARNESSYRPDGIPLSWTVTSRPVFEFVKELWAALRPGEFSKFEEIDRQSLRIAVENHYRGITGMAPDPASSTYRNMIFRIVSGQGFSSSTVNRMASFLLRESSPADLSIFGFSSIAPGSTISDQFSVISRAALLLRVATGSAKDLLSRAAIDPTDLSFWWQKIGLARGFWQVGSTPDLVDLWADVEATLGDLDEFLAQNSSSPPSFHDVISRMGGGFSTLSSHERVGFWGLCHA